MANVDGAQYRTALASGNPEILVSLAAAYLAGFAASGADGPAELAGVDDDELGYPVAAAEFAYRAGFAEGNSAR